MLLRLPRFVRNAMDQAPSFNGHVAHHALVIPCHLVEVHQRLAAVLCDSERVVRGPKTERHLRLVFLHRYHPLEGL